jgi:hypothetical protein
MNGPSPSLLSPNAEFSRQIFSSFVHCNPLVKQAGGSVWFSEKPCGVTFQS